MKETWKNVPNFKDYQASDQGRIKSLKFGKEKILKGTIKGYGYKFLSLYKNNRPYHHQIGYFILLTFKGPCPKGKEVSHLNNKPLDNNITNLNWETRQENQQRRKVNNTDNQGKRNGRAILTEEKVLKIKKLIKKGYTLHVIAHLFNLGISQVSRIKNNKQWKHILIGNENA